MTQQRCISRRSALKLAAVTGAVAAFSNVLDSKALAATDTPAEPETKRIRTSCRGCGKYECGTWVTVEDGKVTKIEGDQSYPGSLGNCCAKSQSSIEACYHPDRLLYPMKRTNPKGEEPGWQRISWDEAYELINQHFSEVVEKYGPSALFATGGTSRLYAMCGGNIVQAWGSFSGVSAGQICKGPRTNLHKTTDGGELHFVENVITPRVCVQWGSGIEVSNYDDAGRVLIDNAHRAAKYINVDTRQSNMAKEADYWLAPRPGTDAAIALAWQKLIIDENLHDQHFLKRWSDAAFLVAPDAPKTEWVRMDMMAHMGMGGPQQVNTLLLTEDQVEEGGSPARFMAWDKLNNCLTYLDSDTGLWEGETFKPKYVEGTEDYLKQAGMWDLYDWEPAKGHYMKEEDVRPGVTPLWVNDLSEFDPAKDPALDGEYEVTLVDGSTITCKPVLQYYYDNTLSQWTPEKAEEVTGVKADLIRESCLTYATPVNPEDGYGNGGIIYAVTHEHTGNAMRVEHALQAIDVILGNTDIPGGHRGPSRPPVYLPDQVGLLEGPQFGVNGGASVPMFDMGTAPADGPVLKAYPFNLVADATHLYWAAKTGDPYPVKAGLSLASGVLQQTNLLETWDAIKSLDFYVDINLWHDPVSDLADVILPAAHWLESECPRTSQGAGGFYGALVKCKEPAGECKNDLQIEVEMFKAAGKPFYGEGTQHPDVADPWEVTQPVMQDKTLAPMDYTWEEYKKDFEEHGWFDSRETNRNGFGSARRYETGWFRAAFDGKPGFYTSSTRNELWSLNLEAAMNDTTGLEWALPTYVEPKSNPVENSWHQSQIEAADSSSYGNPNWEKYIDYTPENYPYIMSTGRRIPVYFHSEHRQLPWCREVWPVPRLEVNPIDAAELGLEQGDWAWIETPFGKIRQSVEISPCVAPGRMNAEHSWWFPEFKRPGKGFDLVGCNCLVDSFSQCEAGGAPQLRGYMANVYKATPENSPFNNPVPCDDDGTPCITSADDPRLKAWAHNYDLGKEA